jgi:hypothetical protein
VSAATTGSFCMALAFRAACPVWSSVAWPGVCAELSQVEMASTRRFLGGLVGISSCCLQAGLGERFAQRECHSCGEKETAV